MNILIIFINEFYRGGSSPHQTPPTAKRELVADFQRTSALVVRITEGRPTQAAPLLSQTLRTTGQVCNEPQKQSEGFLNPCSFGYHDFCEGSC